MEKLKAGHEIEVSWTHFPLHPDTPPEGRALADLFAGREAQLEHMKSNMKGLMEAEGLPYSDRTHTYNSRLAQELGKWAETQPGGEAIHDALFRAYFVDTENIGSVDVLLEVAGKAGLDVEAARAVLTERSFSDAIEEDWKRSMAAGVTGVPTFVAGGYSVVGAQPYETLEMLIEKANTEPVTQQAAESSGAE